MDPLLLLERLDPLFEEHMVRVRVRVIWAITKLQSFTRGMDERRRFRLQREMVTRLQRTYRGMMTRRKLLEMLHLYKWRRRQINTYFLPKTGATRRAVKKRAEAILQEKEVEQRVTKQSLHELRDTILETAAVDPMEDIERTRQNLNAHAQTTGNVSA